LSVKKIRQALKDFGLSQKEAEIYISLAKHGALTGGEISRLTKTHRPTVYRFLKILQKKGVVESTLESPTRYVPIPFETILESNIQTKKEEVAKIEKAKNDLLNDWKSIRKIGVELHLNKFVVIEGRRRIYQKIQKIIEKTKEQLSIILDASDLAHIDQFNLFEKLEKNPNKPKIRFRIITRLAQQDFDLMKALLKRTPSLGVNLKVRNPDLGLSTFPRMMVRDNKEVLLFISSGRNFNSAEKDEVCLWTNCQTLVQTFSGVFVELWESSTDIKQKMLEIETGKPALQTCIITNTETAIKKYEEIIDLAQKEIIMLTSSEGLIDIGNKPALLKNCSKNGISIKIMAPITTKNLEVANQLSKHFEVRHVPVSYLKTTIVDEKHLFQSRATFEDNEESKPRFYTSHYTNDQEYISNRQRILTNLWKTSKTPSMVTLATVTNYSKSNMSSRPSRAFHKIIKRIDGPIIVKEENDSTKNLKEKDIINLHLNAARHPETSFSGGITRYYGFVGQAIVCLPSKLNLPEMLFIFLHSEKNSRFGTDNIFQVFVKQKSPSSNFLPVVYISDNPKNLDFHRRTFAGCFLNDNFLLAKKDQIQIQLRGSNLFCGWTIEVPLIDEYVLPPGSILLEAYGEVKPNIIEMQYPSGYKLWMAYNGIEAFVTYFNPFAKYSGPGTDSLILRNTVLEMYMP
jgi:sugar-specific transcriptional regulator TrmB